jgi:hypothetical protein
MTARKGKPKGKLGTQFRGKLQADYLARSKARYNLWYCYSPKAKADVVLHGDARYFHCLVVESDPEVKEALYDVAALTQRVVGEELAELVCAELRMFDGRVVWRCVRGEATEAVTTKVDNLRVLIEQRVHAELPTHVEVLLTPEITANAVRIQNWNRLLPYLAQARSWPLHEVGNQVATFLHTHSEVALCDVTALAEPGREALYVAALLHGVQFGHFQSNLNEVPWGTTRSRFWVARA